MDEQLNHNDNMNKYLKDYFELTKEQNVNEALNATTEFLRIIETNDPIFITIIKGHLLIENIIECIIKDYVQDYSSLECKYFNDKLNLCAGLGLINDTLIPPIRKINKFRNKYSHNIDFKFEQDNLNEMISSLTSTDKSKYEKKVSKYNNSNSTDLLYRGLVVFIEQIFVDLHMEKTFIEYKKASKAVDWNTSLIHKLNTIYHEKYSSEK